MSTPAGGRRVRRNDVAIYQPQARGLYERSLRHAGGAERQTQLLARALSAAGFSVAHIIFPVRELLEPELPGLSVVQRAPRGVNAAAEALNVWRALSSADAQVHVVRTATPALGIVGAFAARHRRRLVFSSANDGDFSFETIAPASVRLFKLGARLSDAFVVQTARQVELARSTFPRVERIVEIASFVDPPPASARARADAGAPSYFLWIGRLVDYKRPLRYVELARALPDASFKMIPIPTSQNATLPDEVRARAAEVPNLELLPTRPHAETMELIADAVALVSTSRLEGMPNVFLEAWALGIPVLSLSFDPDGRIAAHGLGVDAGGSWERFVESASTVWHEPATRATYREATARYLDEVHNGERIGRAWVDLIASLS